MLRLQLLKFLVHDCLSLVFLSLVFFLGVNVIQAEKSPVIAINYSVNRRGYIMFG